MIQQELDRRILDYKLELDWQPINLKSLLTGAVQRYSQMAPPPNTKIVLSPVETETALIANPIRLGQVMDNLISTAIKYLPPGSTTKVATQKTQDGWPISVKDQGPGITPQDRERLLKEFARLSAQPTGGEKSTGLGLAITRRIVEAHGGTIGVDSLPGQGAAIWFTLPSEDKTGITAEHTPPN